MQKTFRRTRLIAVTLVAAALLAGLAVGAEKPVLKKGDRLAVIGDSITEQKMYSKFIEDYVTMCTPELDVWCVQLGWGGGWDSKTFGSRLRTNRPLFQYILNRRDYHMVRGRRMANDPFPKSRRVAVSMAQDAQGGRPTTPGTPLGWVLVSLAPLHLPANWPEITQQAAAEIPGERVLQRIGILQIGKGEIPFDDRAVAGDFQMHGLVGGGGMDFHRGAMRR